MTVIPFPTRRDPAADADDAYADADWFPRSPQRLLDQVGWHCYFGGSLQTYRVRLDHDLAFRATVWVDEGWNVSELVNDYAVAVRIFEDIYSHVSHPG